MNATAKEIHTTGVRCDLCRTHAGSNLITGLTQIKCPIYFCTQCCTDLGLFPHDLPPKTEKSSLMPHDSFSPMAYSIFVDGKQADQDKIRTRIYDLGVKATQLDNAARGMADDVGEVNGCIKKWLEYGQELDETNLIEELGDVLWRIAQAANAIGKNLQDVIDANVRKLNVRYKGKLTEQEALNRDIDKEREAIRNKFGIKSPLIGRTAKPKFQTNQYWKDEIPWTVIMVHPDGYLGLSDPEGILELRRSDNLIIWDKACEWMVIPVE